MKNEKSGRKNPDTFQSIKSPTLGFLNIPSPSQVCMSAFPVIPVSLITFLWKSYLIKAFATGYFYMWRTD